MSHFDSQTVQLVIIAIAALAVVLQAIVLIAILLGLKKATQSIHADVQELRSSVTPVIISSLDFFTRVAPRIEDTTNDVADIVHTLRARTVALESTAAEITERLQRQSTRVDAMLSGALDSVEQVGAYVSNAVSKPVRHLSALLASAKAVVEVLSAPAPQPEPANTSSDEESPA